MRPHRLRVSGFGPFADTVEVDLDALSGSGLFLLHGDTGAGKTTLLDAMGFALYGRVPGVRNEAKRLRSDHASPDTLTEVQLEATLSGRRMRITRSPEHQRPKRRGDGTTKQHAKVLLEEYAGGRWATLSTAHREADDVVLDLVGMSAEQFFQVVLLPQGEFARFLRADSASRAQLLEKLFGTGLYRSAEEWLVGRRIATSRAVESARSEVALATARVALAAGVAEPTEPSAQWASGLVDDAGLGLDAAARRVSVLTAARDAARSAAESARRLATAQARRCELLATQLRLVDRLPEVTAVRAEADAAARAAEVTAVLGQVSAREQDRVRAAEEVAAARAGLSPVGLTDSDDLQQTAIAARERIGGLESLRALAAEIHQDRSAVAAAAEEVLRLSATRQQLEQRLVELPRQRAVLVMALDGARAAAVRLPAVLAQRDRLAASLVDTATLARVMSSAEQLREELLLARETSVSLRDKAADVREARLEDIRFELASMLVDGDPCAVCGSLFHPDPSEVRGERVTRDDEDSARAAAESAQRAVEELGSRLAAAEADRIGLVARLAGATADSVATELAQVAAELAVVEPAAASVRACEAAVETLDAEQGRAEQQLTGLQVAVAETERRRAESENRAMAGALRLVAEIGSATDLDAAIAAAGSVVTAAEAVLAAEAALLRAETEQAAATAAAGDVATSAGFGTVAEAAAAVRPASWRTETEGLLRTYDDERAATEAALLDPELDVPPDPPADLTGTAAALSAADAALDDATAICATAQGRVMSLASLVPALVTLLTDLGPVLDEARRVRALADLCSGAGANALRMTLSSFVLAARLEEVAAAASERLLRMTQGRYSLVHTDGTARGGARSGLGLLARDTWTGQDRETSTLSGGETFLASLALALGLTDVVTAEAGGARIEALFVDEGFGTLDEETLDEVMDVLDGLREGGRIVGLVSHVAELRARIPAQVEVRKGRAGSRLMVHGC